ncbi:TRANSCRIPTION ELONGATION REGULATOR 1 [Salix viminalis]|uniref:TRANSCRIPTION ELONGATION REGULATOR 1 n=1 Tax=Salix viminalis TaxID=40686 RepID=A0A9Q0TZR0_SALVM|nr:TRANSCRIPTION ELONGATION REGULATOR 1 [Salix viminalis]KAJ6720754.1 TRANSCRIPTION ELONGATION REGULATOR 1 [Salix viminalis]
MESPAWLPQREVKPPPTATDSGVAAATPPPDNSAGNSAQSSYSAPAPTFTYNMIPNMSSGAALNSNPLGQPVPVPGPASSAGLSFSYKIPQTGLDFRGNQQLQSSVDKSPAITQGSAPSMAPIASQSVSFPLHSPSSSYASLSSNLGPTPSQTPATASFYLPPGLSRTPGTLAPQGLVPSAPMTQPSVAVDSLPLGAQRPIMPTMPSSIAVQQQTYPTYPSLPSMAASPQALWMHPPPIGGMPRQPFLPYPAAFPGSFPLPGHGMPHPSVSLPDSQPPGVVPVGHSYAIPMSSSASVHQLPGAPGMQTDLPPPGIDNHNHLYHSGTRDNATVSEPSHVWTAHKTDTGVFYYYNSVTGVSTYEKPPGFNEPDKVPVQPTPVSMENLAGTDWVLITTNDGKKYYHNNKTKLSSWQIPSEVTELRKNQEADVSKGNAMSVSQLNALTEKGSAPITLSAPAANTGGRDATALRVVSMPGASSALDLIKKKLQEFGAPAISASISVSSGAATSESNGSRVVEAAAKGLPSEVSKDKLKDANGDGNVSDSSTDSEDEDDGPSKEECIIQFKEMLKERGVAPFSKWEKELPKLVFDPRFKAIPSHSARRSLFEHYVKTRAEEKRKEKRAAQKAAVEGFKQLLEEASEDIDHNTDYQTFKKKRGNDPRFEALDRKDREHLLNERIHLLKKAAQEKAQAERAYAASSFKSMLRDKGDITVSSRWSRVKDSLRNDPRYKSVKHEDREVFFNEYLSELKAAEEAERDARGKTEEQLLSTSVQDKLKERERELRKRKEREEQEMDRVRVKVRRKEAVASFQALLVETLKDPQASWTESKPKLEKDPQRRATNPDLDPSDIEKLFREHIKMLHERCTNDFKTLLAEVITAETVAQKTEDGKTVLDSWSTAKRLLKPDTRYSKMPRKERETLWRRYAEEMLRKQKSQQDKKEDKHTDSKNRSANESGRYQSGSRRTNDRR